MTNEELDADIIHEALWGEPPASSRAFARVYELYERRVRYCIARAAHRSRYLHRIDELRQDVWFRLLDKDRKLLRYYKPERGPLGAFLCRVSYQQALGAINLDRRQAVTEGNPSLSSEMIEDQQASGFVANLVQTDVYRKLMARASVELDDVDHLVLREVHLNQRRVQDVAREHDLKATLLYKRNERLKKKLAIWCDELEGSGRSANVLLSPSVLLGLILTGLATHPHVPCPASPYPMQSTEGRDA